MQDQAQVVIIGGGITGCSIAYHLAKRGLTDVLLLDKGELTSGSTWHAAGLVTQFHTSPTLMRMRIYSVNLYRQLQAETGPVVGWHEVGSLRLASSQDHFKFLQRQIGQAKALGMAVEMISSAEALRLFPYMSEADLYGALYIPGDGQLEPSGVTMELARRARQVPRRLPRPRMPMPVHSLRSSARASWRPRRSSRRRTAPTAPSSPRTCWCRSMRSTRCSRRRPLIRWWLRRPPSR